MFAVLLLLVAAPAREATADAAVIQQKLKSCGHSEGPVRFVWAGKAALAYACTQAGQTTLLIYAPLPSGQYALICDAVPQKGIAHKLALRTVSGKTLLHMQSIVFSPDEERVFESVFAPGWGKCTRYGLSEVVHPEDGLLLREPLAGIEFDADGFDVWEQISRLEFRAESVAGPKRRAAMALRGKRFEVSTEPKAPAFVSSEIVVAAVEALPHTMQKDHVTFAQSLVRGVRVRFAGPFARVIAGTFHLELNPTAKTWRTGPQLFGAGILAKGAGKVADEGVVLFDPPLELAELRVEGKDIEQVIVFKDAEDWPLFEAHEDFGEHAIK